VRADSITPIESDFDVNDFLRPAPIPPRVDNGNFRLIANSSHLSYDDPVVFPGQPGAAHLHHFFGNRSTDAFSTYESLRANPHGTTNSDMINGSAYWVPAMLDGRGNAVMFPNVSVYYKQWDHPRRVGLPAGIRFLMRGEKRFWLENSRGLNLDSNGEGANLEAILAAAQPGDKIGISIAAGGFWDGVHIDSPDHVSHISEDQSATHPFHIPILTYSYGYEVRAGDDPTLWRLSSDGDAPAGSTLHGDYFEAWEPRLRELWQRNVMDGNLDANGANLGDGRSGVEWSGFTYDQREPHLIPVPPHAHH
jgi:hypothetical protein